MKQKIQVIHKDQCIYINFNDQLVEKFKMNSIFPWFSKFTKPRQEIMIYGIRQKLSDILFNVLYSDMNDLSEAQKIMYLKKVTNDIIEKLKK